MDKERLLKCRFSHWYSTFKSCTFRSVVLPTPEGFVKFMLADGLTLPAEENGENESDSDAPSKAYDFDEFEGRIRAAINELGGSVLPKLNWSAPKDATWISFDNSMRCHTPADVYLLLKSSDFVAYDLTLVSDGGELNGTGLELVLRRWHDLNPACEFRCFVRQSKLLAICQRWHSDYYPYIREDKGDIVTDIVNFFDQKISGRFPDNDYAFDVYRKPEGKTLLLDFNPFYEATDGLLFSWDELSDPSWPAAAVDGDKPVFRFVESQDAIGASQYQRYAFPSDLGDLAAGEDAAKLIDLLNLKRRPEESDDDDGEDEEIVPSPLCESQG